MTAQTQELIVESQRSLLESLSQTIWINTKTKEHFTWCTDDKALTLSLKASTAMYKGLAPIKEGLTALWKALKERF